MAQQELNLQLYDWTEPICTIIELPMTYVSWAGLLGSYVAECVEKMMLYICNKFGGDLKKIVKWEKWILFQVHDCTM